MLSAASYVCLQCFRLVRFSLIVINASSVWKWPNCIGWIIESHMWCRYQRSIHAFLSTLGGSSKAKGIVADWMMPWIYIYIYIYIYNTYIKMYIYIYIYIYMCVYIYIYIFFFFMLRVCVRTFVRKARVR